MEIAEYSRIHRGRASLPRLLFLPYVGIIYCLFTMLEELQRLALVKCFSSSYDCIYGPVSFIMQPFYRVIAETSCVPQTSGGVQPGLHDSLFGEPQQAQKVSQWRKVNCGQPKWGTWLPKYNFLSIDSNPSTLVQPEFYFWDLPYWTLLHLSSVSICLIVGS